uniref:Uncharacterized protein n=1 Tax=viral metagenome TaxID=1070528 RepID=A0A6C0HSM1_9ZZZZ
MKILTMFCCLSSKKYVENVRISPLMSPSYENTISEVIFVAKSIDMKKKSSDGRIDSAMKEEPFLKELEKTLLSSHPLWKINISPPRGCYDIKINSIHINLKITECKANDNAMNKPSMYFSITGQTDYPYSSSWNDFLDMIIKAKSENKIKRTRDKSTEYHYLVKNKVTGDVLLKPIFDIHTYMSNPSNNLQINWKNEFNHRDYCIDESQYIEKVKSLMSCIQTSVREMILRTKEFADADISTYL